MPEGGKHLAIFAGPTASHARGFILLSRDLLRIDLELQIDIVVHAAMASVAHREQLDCHLTRDEEHRLEMTLVGGFAPDTAPHQVQEIKEEVQGAIWPILAEEDVSAVILSEELHQPLAPYLRKTGFGGPILCFSAMVEDEAVKCKIVYEKALDEEASKEKSASLGKGPDDKLTIFTGWSDETLRKLLATTS